MRTFESVNNIPLVNNEEELPIENIEAGKKFNEITAIAELLASSGSDIKVRYGKKPGWRYIFGSNTIEVCPNDVANKSPEFCKGVISHEAAHEIISKVDFIPKEEWNESGFKFLLNAVEDPRVNNWMSAKYAGPKEWLNEVYDDEYNDEQKITDLAEQQVGYTPKHIRFGLEVIRRWHTGEFSDDLPDDVRAALEKTDKIAQACYNTVPSMTPSPAEIVAKARLMYKLTRGAIWPEYKKLVDASYENAQWDELLKKMLEDGDFELGEGEGDDSGMPIPFDQLPDAVKEKLKDKIRKKLEDMDPEERKNLEDKAKADAKKKLDGLEAGANDVIGGKFGEPGKRSSEDKKSENNESIKRQMEEAMAEAEAKLDATRSEYEKTVLELRSEIDNLTQFFLAEFMSKRQPTKKPAPSGADINMSGGGPMLFEATGNYDELFLKTISHEKNDFRVTMLVDLSGSMQNAKILETFKGLAMVAEVLNNVGIPFSIHGFQDDVYEFKAFEEEFDNKVRDKMMRMIGITSGPGARNNSDAFCVNKIYETIVLANLAKTNLFMVMSDGLPAPGGNRYNSAKSSEGELSEVTDKIQTNPEVDLIGFGIGPETDHVKGFYKDSIQAKNVKLVPEQLKKKLKEKIVV
ncbi:hypothetical protein KBC40_01200 [Patescibacteria group bacterium]|nr:hypothetical protein [Patescibacteria group bacterium]